VFKRESASMHTLYCGKSPSIPFLILIISGVGCSSSFAFKDTCIKTVCFFLWKFTDKFL